MVEIFDNIHKIYQYQAPCEELAEYIAFFSESSCSATEKYLAGESFSVKLFPSWTPTIWFNLGSPYKLSIANQHYVVQPNQDVLLLRNTIVERRNLPTDHIFTVKFSAGGFEGIFGIKQGCLGSELIGLSHIIPSSIIQDLKRIDNFEERVMLLQGFFLQIKQRRSWQEHYFKTVQRAIKAYETSNMESRNSEIASEVSATNKTLYRYFNHVVGTTPKNYFSVIRVREALQKYVSHKADFSPYDFGYYDMSHFYKEVIKFTGSKLIDNGL
ncbi:helix-turn-helix domain-containing protein [Emticicia sp. 17c]|uniref:helix-turn-helix domain-containing protein n=1 Tax=Emticicia sp. 17c TaxID=3127704 RepID=UPI00301D0E95